MCFGLHINLIDFLNLSAKHIKKQLLHFIQLLCPLTSSSIHWYVGVLESLNQQDFQVRIFNNLQNISNKMAERNLRSLGTEYQQMCKRRMNAPKGYQIVNIKRDGQCLYNAIIEGMIHKQLAIPSAWLTLNSWERGKHMRQILT